MIRRRHWSKNFASIRARVLGGPTTCTISLLLIRKSHEFVVRSRSAFIRYFFKLNNHSPCIGHNFKLFAHRRLGLYKVDQSRTMHYAALPGKCDVKNLCSVTNMRRADKRAHRDAATARGGADHRDLATAARAVRIERASTARASSDRAARPDGGRPRVEPSSIAAPVRL